MAEEFLNRTGSDQATGKIPIGVSSCLLGDRVRYDGGHKANSVVGEILAEYFEFRKFCPELDIGLGVPRKPIQLTRSDSGEIRCRAIDDPAKDHTDALTRCADAQQQWQEILCAYILKSNSPSCGMERVKVSGVNGVALDGIGVYAARLMKNFPYLPVEEEGRLDDRLLRENFVQRAFVMRDWHQLMAQDFSVTGFNDFHDRHMSLVMSDKRPFISRLEKIVASTGENNLQENGRSYLVLLMRALKASTD